jgi:hypothetical protein
MKRSRQNPISKKRRAQLAERKQVREFVLARDNGCIGAALVSWVPCAGPIDVHEVVRRSQDSTAWLNPELCVSLCRAHHDYTHHNPGVAYQIGLLRRRTA